MFLNENVKKQSRESLENFMGFYYFYLNFYLTSLWHGT